MRQPGSSFKPFIYSAALEKGFSPATIINDAPFFVPGDKTGGEDWEPKNYDGKFDGPMRLRMAVAKSKNLVLVRVLQAIGPQYAQDYITRFGFDPKQHPPYLTMGLGAGSATPLQMAAAYAVFANGGYRVSPYLISRVTDSKGNVLSEAKPVVSGQSAERAIDPRNAFVMTSMLRDVVNFGTATRALSLGHKDLAGKTGTTNENVDAWFCGFNASIVGVSWIGFDQPRSLGNNETGGVAALPIWISFMQKALKGVPEKKLEVPEGVINVRVNPDTGLRDDASNVSEYFFAEYPPAGGRSDGLAAPMPGRTAQDVRDQIF
jgi:penicillin-binding protein 1A